MSRHLVHVLQALLVTFLWSTSWVLIKVGLVDIPALTFAGLRYALATLVLLPFVLRGDRLAALRRLPGPAWRDLLLLGVVLYALTQGAQFLALAHLPAATLSLVLSFSPLVVAMLATGTLREALAPRQWGASPSSWSAPSSTSGRPRRPSTSGWGSSSPSSASAPTPRAACSAARSTAAERWTRCWRRS